MKERISRRDFLKWGALTIAGAALGADTLYATRAFQPTHEVTPGVASDLEELSKEMVENIESYGFEDPFRFPRTVGITVFDRKITFSGSDEEKGEEVLVKVKPDPQIFAQALLQISYLEGGQDEANKTSMVVQRQGLQLMAVDRLGIDLGPGVLAAVACLPQWPIFLVLKDEFIAAYFRGSPYPLIENHLFHELYHINQYARDPNFFSKSEVVDDLIYEVAIPLAAGGFFGVKTYRALKNNKIYNRLEETIATHRWLDRALEKNEFYRKLNKTLENLEERLPPRKLLRMELGVLAGILTLPIARLGSKVIEPFTEPSELQAYLQTGSYFPGMPSILTNHPSFDKFRGRFFSFEEVK